MAGEKTKRGNYLEKTVFMKNRRKIFKFPLIGIGIITFALILKTIHNKLYYKEYNQIKEKLSNVKGARLIDLYGNPDITYENICSE
ncbi:MAG: hypothetical protein HC906_18730 [Bacteroidales bacterium]|nr:hypothetical protein [Bacteroidales bacterium]